MNKYKDKDIFIGRATETGEVVIKVKYKNNAICDYEQALVLAAKEFQKASGRHY